MPRSRFRVEKDSMGPMKVPAAALWGASTQRAVENFPLAGRPIPAEVIHAFGLLKSACAKANWKLGKLPATKARAIIAAADEVAAGSLTAHFPVDIYQTGSGTSSNMNVNEVIANRVNQVRRLPMGSHQFVHPNDHVNMGQSSNDTFPTAMHVAAAVAIRLRLIPALNRLAAELERKSRRWDSLVKVGRTHLMDATPIRVGQVFSGYAAQARLAVERCDRAASALQPLAIGGTAVGTGINTHKQFARRVCVELSRSTGVKFREAGNHFEAQATQDSAVESHAYLKTVAVSLSKIAADIRLLGSGPRCGIGELLLPAIQPGSSIMPGKVNPVVCESVIQVCCRVIGNDAAVTAAGLGGVGSIFELNVAMPVMADALMESIKLLAAACTVLVDKLLTGLEVNRARCAELVEQSLMMVTSLAPVIGYDAAGKIAKEAMAEGKTIRQLARQKKLIDDKALARLLDARRMTEPS